MSPIKYFASAIAAFLCAPSSIAEELVINLVDIQDVKGSIHIALYQESGYDNGEPVSADIISVNDISVGTTMAGLEPGQYALKIFHDIDGDGKMATNQFGVPSEPYAFSNNAIARFGPVAWNEAKFEIPHEGVTQTISIK